MPWLYILVQCFVPSAPQVSALKTHLWVRTCQVFNGSHNWQGRQRSVFKELFLKPAGKWKNLPCFDTVICLHVVLDTWGKEHQPFWPIWTSGGSHTTMSGKGGGMKWLQWRWPPTWSIFHGLNLHLRCNTLTSNGPFTFALCLFWWLVTKMH